MLINIETNNIIEYESISDLAKAFNLSRSTVSNLIKSEVLLNKKYKILYKKIPVNRILSP